MRTPSLVCVLAAALVLGASGSSSAQVARLRHVTSVYFDSQGAGLHLPEAVACGPDGQVVVGDTGNGRLLRFTYREKTVSGGTEIRIPQVTSPARVHLNSKGEIYVLDGAERRILVLGPDGEFSRVLGFDGVPPPAGVVPKALAIDSDDNVYVLDVFAARVLVLDAQSQVQRVLGLPTDTGFATDLTVDFAGNLLLLDSIGRRILLAARDAGTFTPLGKDLRPVLATLPTSVTASKGVIFVAEGSGSTIVALGRDGTFLSRQLSMGWTEGSLNYPSQICVSDRDDVFVADRDNSRIQVFQLLR